jgi:hypothetical protein
MLGNVNHDDCEPAKPEKKKRAEGQQRKRRLTDEAATLSLRLADAPIGSLVATMHVPHPWDCGHEQAQRKEDGKAVGCHPSGTGEEHPENDGQEETAGRGVAEAFQ